LGLHKSHATYVTRIQELRAKRVTRTAEVAAFETKFTDVCREAILARSRLIVRAGLIFLSGCMLGASQVDLFQAVVSLQINKTAYETLQRIKDPQVKAEIYCLVGASLLVAPILQFIDAAIAVDLEPRLWKTNFPAQSSVFTEITKTLGGKFKV